MTERNARKRPPAQPQTVHRDGVDWIPRAGGLWADYRTAASYQGLASESAMRNYVCRHELRTLQYGKRKLVNKADLDQIAGAA